MNLFKWHSDVTWQMYLARVLKSPFSDLAEFDAAYEHLVDTAQKIAAKLGLRCTVTLQLPSDERRVRLLKERQPSDTEDQCGSCSFAGPMGITWNGTCLNGHKFEKPDCPDWAESE